MRLFEKYRVFTAIRTHGWKKIALYCLFGTHRVDPIWYWKVKIRCFCTRKTKVGFGPIRSGEDDLSVRKWRIDPIIDAINRKSSVYRAGFFVDFQQMDRFDVVVIVKAFSPGLISEMEKLRGRVTFVYDIVDNPNDEEKYRYYFRAYPKFLELIDAFILSTPVHRRWMEQQGIRHRLIEHPVLNPTYKTVYLQGPQVRILAQGYRQNLFCFQWLEPLLPLLSQKVGRPVRLYYHSEEPGEETEWVTHLKWDVASCFEEMNRADLAVTMKELRKPHQYTKPSTKVIAYMAAGLPVVCLPSPADQMVMQHRINGFFAYRTEDWLYWIQKLALSPALRKQIGAAARKSARENFHLDKIGEKYEKLWSEIVR